MRFSPIKWRSVFLSFLIKRQPFLDTLHTGTRCQIQKQDQIQYQGGGQDTVATQKIHFDLHRVAQPSEDVDIIPALLIIPPRRVIVYSDFMVNILVIALSAIIPFISGGKMWSF